MGDSAWESIYSNGKHINSWPWSDVISLFHRYSYLFPRTEKLTVMELGPGTGNNFPFFSSLGIDYFGIEQSETAVEIIHSKWPELIGKVSTGDFTDIAFSPDSFDLVLDRASVTHASTEEITATVSSTFTSLKPGGLYVGVDWFSTSHGSFGKGAARLDENTEQDFFSGQFQNLGKVHFSDSEHIISLFEKFEMLELSEKVIQHNPNPDQKEIFASWNFVARKP